MRKFRLVEPTSEDDPTPVVTIWTEEEILAAYFDHWAANMRRIGRDVLITRANCLEDFITVHWAQEIQE